MPDVTLIAPSDADELFHVLTEEMWKENAMFSCDENKVKNIIHFGANPSARKENDPIVIIGIIRKDNVIAATCGLMLSQFWYTSEWHVEDIWHFVREPYRKSEYARALIEFSKRIQGQLTVPLVVGVLSDLRTEAKIRLYRRLLGDPVGAVFVWPAMVEIKEKVKAA